MHVRGKLKSKKGMQQVTYVDEITHGSKRGIKPFFPLQRHELTNINTRGIAFHRHGSTVCTKRTNVQIIRIINEEYI